MKKLLAVLPLLAGGAWAGTTLVAGKQTEPAYLDLIAQINQQSPVPFVVESYKQGYLSSTAVTKVMQSHDQDADVALRLKHEISHSTVAMDDAGARLGQSSIKTTFLLNEVADPDLQKMLDGFNGLAPIELISRVGISGAADNLLKLNPFEIEEDGKTVVSSGGEIEFFIDADKSIKGSGELKPIRATDVGAKQEIFASDVATIEFDLRLHEAGFYEGSQRYNVARIAGINANTGQPYELNDLLIEASSDFTGDTGSGNMLASVGGIKSMLPVNSGSLKASVDGLSTEAIAGFKQLMSKIENLPEDDPEAVQAVMSEYAKLITEFFQGGSQLNYNLTLNNDGGSAVADLNLKRVVDAVAITDATTLSDLLMSLAGELTFDADGAAINLTPLGYVLQGPPASDFISFDGSHYNSKIVLAENIIDLNGNPFPLDMMLGPYMEMSLTDAMQFIQ